MSTAFRALGYFACMCCLIGGVVLALVRHI